MLNKNLLFKKIRRNIRSLYEGVHCTKCLRMTRCYNDDGNKPKDNNEHLLTNLNQELDEAWGIIQVVVIF